MKLLLLSKSKPLRWVSIWLPLKRLDGFCPGETAQFQAMTSKLCLSDIEDLINLTFCCQQATVITDFSDLERVGKEHSLAINGGAMPSAEYDQVDGQAAALDLIQNGAGVVTPYGVVYDNGMKLEQLYDGRHFPPYLYEPSMMILEVKSDSVVPTSDYLYLPCPDRQLQRTLARVSSGPSGFQLEVTMDDLPPRVSNGGTVSHTTTGCGWTSTRGWTHGSSRRIPPFCWRS